MKYIDNDMDDMFNKAGQHYPLNTDKKNWAAVHKELQSDEATVANTSKTKPYFRFLPLLLLLLLPVFVMIYDNIYDNINTHLTDKSSLQNNEKANPQAQDQTGVQPNSEKEDEVDVISDEVASADKTAITQSPVFKKKSENISDQQVINPSIITSNKNQKKIILPDNGLVKSEKLLSNKTGKTYKTYKQHNIYPVDGPGIDSRNAMHRYNFPALALFSQDQLTPVNIGIPLTLKSYEQPTTSTTSSKTKKQATAAFYYGLVVGPDLSTIKYQQVRHAGYSAGILVGYQFSRNWSVEVSGLWSSKKYYTDGKYFDKTAAQFSQGVDIYYLDGGCNMIELPIAVRYLFSPGKNSFFATAGLNSYFMNKESYEYLANANGSEYEGYRSYKNSGNHVFSNLQLSGGYQFKAFRKTNIRIEPYLQLPLKHIGIGKMPITSAGVHFGLMRNTR